MAPLRGALPRELTHEFVDDGSDEDDDAHPIDLVQDFFTELHVDKATSLFLSTPNIHVTTR
jgi:hypothetical protein